MHPSSPTSSATFVEHSSPAYKAGLGAQYKAWSPQESYTLFDSDVEGYDIPTTSFVSLASEILGDTNIPFEDLKMAVTAQYTTCKKLCHLIMTRIWQVEEASRWTDFLNRSLGTLKKQHEAAEDGLRVWIESTQKECTEVSKPLSSATTNLLKAKHSLSLGQSRYNNLEGLLISHGVTGTDLTMANESGEDSESARD
ncbi:hypothetical protein BDR03DRAFT_987938 [Suillus americanus]|nr:hypothetical protein BDR03DRAFT_987938 [Suillus americanus]